MRLNGESHACLRYFSWNKSLRNKRSLTRTLLLMSLFVTAEYSACSRASTSPSHSLSLCRASAPSELTFLQTQDSLRGRIISQKTSDRRIWARASPQTSWRVLEDRVPLRVSGSSGVVGVAPQTRVRNDDLVGQRLQAVIDDDHLQRFMWWEIPQRSWNTIWTSSHSEKTSLIPDWWPQIKLKYLEQRWPIFLSSVWNLVRPSSFQ